MKRKISKKNKSLWENLGFSIPKPTREAEKFNFSRELNRLEKTKNLTQSDLNKIKSTFNDFQKNSDKVNFKYFLKFFNAHKEGITFFYDLDIPRNLVMSLVGSYITSPQDFFKIHYYNKWLREGRGFCYDIKIKDTDLKKLVSKRKGFFVPRIKNSYKKYSEEDRVFFDKKKFLLFVLKKGSNKNNSNLYVGIRIFKDYAKLFLSRNFSPIERNLVLKIAIGNKISLETVPQELDPTKLIKFIKDSSSIENPELDIEGISFEKNGVILLLEESQGKPEENSVNVELKKVLPKDLEFKQLKKINFYYEKDGTIKINKYQINNYNGVVRLSLNSIGKGKEEYLEALDMFKSQFGFFPDKAYSDPNEKEEKWYKQFLDNNKILNYKGLELPITAVEVLNKLKKLGLVTEINKKAFGSICFSTCPKRGQIIWSLEKLKCASCGGDLWQVKEQLSYEKPLRGLKKYFKERLEVLGYKVIPFSKEVFNKKIDLLKAFNQENEEINILFSIFKKDIKYLQELSERSSNLLIVECGSDADSIDESVSFKKLSSFILSKEDYFREALIYQKGKWKERKISCANKSLINLIRIHNKEDKSYKGFQFEKDCFNLINSFLDNCVWLGSKDSGGKVPDGIASLKEIKGNEGCLIWDCKLSFRKDGATVGSLKKNKTYVDGIFNHDLIKKLGGLKSYIIISNKANQDNYLKVFTKLKEKYTGAKEKINYSLLDSRQLIQLYEYIKENSKYLESNLKKKEGFFKDLNLLLLGDGVKIIKKEEVEALLLAHKITPEDKILLEEASSFRPKEKIVKD